MTKLTLILALLMMSAVSLDAQFRREGPTLRELALQGGGVGGGIGSGWVEAPFRSIASRADIVVEGTVTKRHSYTTPDERDMFTDYELSVAQVIFARTSQSSDRPGVPKPFIFKTHGGTLIFDGVPMTITDKYNGRSVTLKAGEHVVMFGHYDSTDAKWQFSAWDVFYISGDLVKNDLPVLDGHDEGLSPLMPMAMFVAKVREAVAGGVVAAQPVRFGFRFEVKDCPSETFDTLSGVLSKKIGAQGSQVVTATLALTDSQMQAIQQALQRIDFFDYPYRFVGVPEGTRELTTTSPSTTYRLEVHSEGVVHTVTWNDGTKPRTAEADQLRDVLTMILGNIHSHPSYIRLPPALFGCE